MFSILPVADFDEWSVGVALPNREPPENRPETYAAKTVPSAGNCCILPVAAFQGRKIRRIGGVPSADYNSPAFYIITSD